MLEKVLALTGRISMKLFNTEFKIRVEHDNVHGEKGRIFLQVTYDAPCTHTGEDLNWHGRKWYLSEYMTDDEIIKTSYAAFEAAVKHEIMEGFKVDNIILFNPHLSYTELLAISHKEVKREVKN